MTSTAGRKYGSFFLLETESKEVNIGKLVDDWSNFFTYSLFI